MLTPNIIIATYESPYQLLLYRNITHLGTIPKLHLADSSRRRFDAVLCFWAFSTATHAIDLAQSQSQSNANGHSSAFGTVTKDKTGALHEQDFYCEMKLNDYVPMNACHVNPKKNKSVIGLSVLPLPSSKRKVLQLYRRFFADGLLIFLSTVFSTVYPSARTTTLCSTMRNLHQKYQNTLLTSLEKKI